MTSAGSWMSDPLVERIGWALVHFLWQGAVVGVLTAVLLFALRRRTANTRYVTAVAMLLLAAACPAVTIAVLPGATTPAPEATPFATLDTSDDSLGELQPGTAVETTDTAGLAAAMAFPAPQPASGSPTVAETEWIPAASELVPWFVFAWVIGASVLSVRLFVGWLMLQRLRRNGTSIVGDHLSRSCVAMCTRLRISRPVVLLESGLMQVPATIGWLRPVVLIPASVVTGLPPEETEALLAHELAHVRRHDYIVNLLQGVIETLLYYHPCIWWISRRIRVEREHCCDDLAVAMTGERTTYARALTSLVQAGLRTPRIATAASGGDLIQRIRRLVAAPSERQRTGGRAAGPVTALFLLVFVGAAGVAVSDPTWPSPSDPAPSAQEDKKGDTGQETSKVAARTGTPDETRSAANDDRKSRSQRETAGKPEGTAIQDGETWTVFYLRQVSAREAADTVRKLIGHEDEHKLPKIMVDERVNAVFVRGSQSDVAVIESLLSRVDGGKTDRPVVRSGGAEPELMFQVFQLRRIAPEDVVRTLKALFEGTTSRSRFEADSDRLLVAAPAAEMKTIEDLVKRLDGPQDTRSQILALQLRHVTADAALQFIKSFGKDFFRSDLQSPLELTVRRGLSIPGQPVTDPPQTRLFVQGAPADVARVRSIVQRLDQPGNETNAQELKKQILAEPNAARSGYVRARNDQLWAARRDLLRTEFAGQFVLIQDGRIHAPYDTWEQALAAGRKLNPGALHRYVFQPGEDDQDVSFALSPFLSDKPNWVQLGRSFQARAGLTVSPFAWQRNGKQVTWGGLGGQPRIHLSGLVHGGSTLKHPTVISGLMPWDLTVTESVARELKLDRCAVPGTARMEGSDVSCRKVWCRVRVPELDIDMPVVAIVIPDSITQPASDKQSATPVP